VIEGDNPAEVPVVVVEVVVVVVPTWLELGLEGIRVPVSDITDGFLSFLIMFYYIKAADTIT